MLIKSLLNLFLQRERERERETFLELFGIAGINSALCSNFGEGGPIVAREINSGSLL